MKNQKLNFVSTVFILLSGLTALASAPGFSAGNQFTAQEISGNLTVQCFGNPSGPNMGGASCRDEILNPSEYSFFVGPAGIVADQVSLQATREDGSVSVEKTESYDAKVGKSTGSFNLWIYTVFQRPLLGPGKNSVRFQLKNNGQIVQQGTFVAVVRDGGAVRCNGSGFYTSSFSGDCVSPQNFCSQYFREFNYCQ